MKTTFLSIFIFLLAINANSQNLHPTGLKQKNLKDYSFVKKSDLAIKSSLPQSVDHSAHIAPVGNQGSYGSCVGWASGYYYKTYQEYEDYGWSVVDQNHIFSPSFVYNHINGGGDHGAFFEDAFKLLIENGCATIKEFPYQMYTNWPSESAYFNALKYRSNEFFYINAQNLSGIQQLKQHVADGHCAVLGISVYPNFDNIQQYNYTYCSADVTGSSRGDHAVTIIGYDDNRVTSDGTGAFKLVNSWGTGWGQSGFFWMSYTAVMNPVISGREGYYTTDKLHYNPELVTFAKITHSSKFKVQLKFAIGANCGPLWSKRFFNFYMGCNADVAFPNNNIVFDLTDGISYIYPFTDNRIYIVCKDTVQDGRRGSLDYLKGTNINWGMTVVSTEAPAVICDSVLSTYAGFSIGPNLSTNVGIKSVDLNDYMIPGGVTPKATIRNYGTVAQSFPVTFQVSQNTGQNKSIVYTSTKNISNLQPYTELQVNFDNWNAPVGNYSMLAFTKLPYDSSQINDSLLKTINILSLPYTPVQISPANGSQGLELSQILKWNKVSNSVRYNFVIASDSLFTNIVYKDSLLTDTTKSVYLSTLTKYFWKVCAINQVGSGLYSETWSLKTKGMPCIPNRITPVNNSNNLSKPVVFKWNKAFELTDNGAIDKYLLEITKDTVTMANYFLRVPTDTVWTEDSISSFSTYYWRISAKGNIGWGQRSSWWKFTTTTDISKINESVPDRYDLFNNYPNPFNPETKIKFDLPQNSLVTLKIYDISGREVEELINNKLDAGSYMVSFKADKFSSGVYFYRLIAGNFISTKKMILLK